MRARLKKRWYRVGAFLLAFGVLVSIAPLILYYNQHLIADHITGKLNALQNGHTTVGKIRISPFRAFPYISIDLHELAFYSDQTQKEKIYELDDVYVGFDAWKLLQGDYKLRKVIVQDGRLHVKRLQDGRLNLLIAKGLREEDTTQDETPLQLDLKAIELKNIVIEKTDQITGQHIEIKIKEAESSFSQDAQRIASHLEAELEIVDLSLKDFHFFTNKHIRLFSDVEYKNDSIALKKTQLELEGARFDATGGLALTDNFYLDLEIKGQKPDFKLLTSFAPDEVYQKLESYRDEGEVYFQGRIQGDVLDTIPKIDIEFGCKNAQFINPDARKSIRDLNFSGSFTNGEARSLRTSELYIENLNGKPESSWFRGAFHVKNFEDPYFSIDLHADIDLASLDEIIDLEDFEELEGKIRIDITVDELLDYNDVEGLVEKLRDGKNRRLVLKDVRFFAPAYYPHPVRNLHARLSLIDSTFQIDTFAVKIQDSDLNIRGGLSNIGALLHGKDTAITATLSLESERLNLKTLLAFDSTLAASTDEEITNLSLHTHFLTNSRYIRESDALPQGEFWIDSLSLRLKHYAHRLRNFHADFIIGAKNIRTKAFRGRIDQSDLRFAGSLTNYPALLGNGRAEPVRLHADITSKQLILKDLFTYKGKNYLPEEYAEEYCEDFEVIATLEADGNDLLAGNFLKKSKLTLEDLHGKFRYHKLKFEQFHGEITLKDSVVAFREGRGRLGRSGFAFAGSLHHFFDSTKENEAELRLTSNYLDIDELIDYEETDTAQKINHDSVFNIFSVPFPNAKVKADIGELVYHRYHLKNIKADARTTTDHYLYIEKLDFDAANGHININGYFNGSDPEHIYLSSDVKLTDTDIDKLFFKFDNFGQDYLLQENVHGRLSGSVHSKVRVHTDLTPYLNEVEAHAEMTITDGSLVHFPPFESLSEYLSDKDLDSVRFGKLTNTFDIKDGAVSIPRMEISSTLGYMFVSGKQDFADDLRMDYLIEVPFRLARQAAWNSLFKKANKTEKREEVEIEEADKSDLLLRISVFGTPDDFDFKLGKKKKR